MKNSKTLLQEVVSGLKVDESAYEISSIAYFLLENYYGLSRTDIVSGKLITWSPEKAAALQNSVQRINRGEPVQYVVGSETFYGRRFQVNPSVLIPRPETEELIGVVLSYVKTATVDRMQNLRVLDIGTGSGCIAITLSLELPPEAEIYASDVSAAALAVARGNARDLNARVTFLEHDILRDKLPLSELDVIVSNPPYVTEKEKAQMKPNVLAHEPATALFVNDDDPLAFYRAIVAQATEGLREGGLLAVEINEHRGLEVARLLLNGGFSDVNVLKDLSGKNRIVRGVRIGR